MASWFRSLRWRIQAWHAFILVLVIGLFGGMLQWEMTRSHWDGVDEELVSAARVLEGALRLAPIPILNSLSQDIAMPPGPRLPAWKKESANKSVRSPNSRPSRPMRPDRDGSIVPRSESLSERSEIDWGAISPDTSIPEFMDDWERLLVLPDSLPQQLGRRVSFTYFVIWRDDNSVLKQSAIPTMVSPPREYVRQDLLRHRYVTTQRGEYREVFIRGPHNTLVCVGRSVTAEGDRIRARLWGILGIGAVTLAAGLAGGWWLSRRAVEPIETMGRTASLISATNLSQRMDVANVDTELAQLGGVLNGMLQRIEQAFSQQQQFTADASHELRTPIASFLANTELALSRPRTVEEYQRHLSINLQSAQRMKRLVESLLAIARIDTPVHQLDKKPVEIMALLRSVIATLENKATSHSITVHCMGDSVTLHADEVSLGQAFLNLVENAIHYGKPGGSVHIRVCEQNNRCEISFEDDGIGISQEDCGNVFQRFFRADPARSSHRGGFGLGLAFAKRVVELHGGAITVSSTLGQGSVFTLSIPK